MEKLTDAKCGNCQDVDSCLRKAKLKKRGAEKRGWEKVLVIFESLVPVHPETHCASAPRKELSVNLP